MLSSAASAAAAAGGGGNADSGNSSRHPGSNCSLPSSERAPAGVVSSLPAAAQNERRRESALSERVATLPWGDAERHSVTLKSGVPGGAMVARVGLAIKRSRVRSPATGRGCVRRLWQRGIPAPVYSH